MTAQDLLKLKTEVETAKQTVSEKKGHQTALLNQLKTDWGCKSVEEAEKKLKSMNTEIDELDTKIEETIAEIETKYNTEE
jgi:hypothetical protein